MADEKTAVVVKGIEGQTAPPASDGGQSAAAVAQSVKVGGKEYASWDEVGKAYEEVQKELGKWTTQYGDLKKQNDEVSRRAQQWDEWWKTVSPLWGDDVEGLLKQKLEGGRQPQAQRVQPQAQASQAPGKQAFDGFELLRPEEQASRIQQMVMEQVQNDYNQKLQQTAQWMQNHLAEREKWYGTYLTNHLSLMRRALEERQRNPQFDVDAVMEEAAKAIGGQLDPIQLGQQILDAKTFQARLEQVKKDAYEQGKKDLEQEIKNKKQEPPAAADFTAPKYTFPTAQNGSRHNLGSMRDKAAEALAKKFGPQLFARE